MNEILDKLKKYFQETPKKEIKEGWNKAKENAPKNSVNITDFLVQNAYNHGKQFIYEISATDKKLKDECEEVEKEFEND